MVKSESVYSPQTYLEAVTGKCYIVHEDTIYDLLDEIQTILSENGYELLWDYPLTEIGEIVANDINVVLVELTGDDENGEWRTIYRWFEVPEQFPIEAGGEE